MRKIKEEGGKATQPGLCDACTLTVLTLGRRTAGPFPVDYFNTPPFLPPQGCPAAAPPRPGVAARPGGAPRPAAALAELPLLPAGCQQRCGAATGHGNRGGGKAPPEGRFCPKPVAPSECRPPRSCSPQPHKSYLHRRALCCPFTPPLLTQLCPGATPVRGTAISPLSEPGCPPAPSHCQQHLSLALVYAAAPPNCLSSHLLIAHTSSLIPSSSLNPHLPPGSFAKLSKKGTLQFPPVSLNGFSALPTSPPAHSPSDQVPQFPPCHPRHTPSLPLCPLHLGVSVLSFLPCEGPRHCPGHFLETPLHLKGSS